MVGVLGTAIERVGPPEDAKHVSDQMWPRSQAHGKPRGASVLRRCRGKICFGEPGDSNPPCRAPVRTVPPSVSRKSGMTQRETSMLKATESTGNGRWKTNHMFR